MLFFVGGLLIGGLLGARFTVLALVPGLIVALGLAAIAGGSGGGAVGWSVHLVVLVVFLQVGYVCGAALRLFVAPVRAVRKGKELRSPL
jgi:hypothetical protein